MIKNFLEEIKIFWWQLFNNKVLKEKIGEEYLSWREDMVLKRFCGDKWKDPFDGIDVADIWMGLCVHIRMGLCVHKVRWLIKSEKESELRKAVKSRLEIVGFAKVKYFLGVMRLNENAARLFVVLPPEGEEDFNRLILEQ